MNKNRTTQLLFFSLLAVFNTSIFAANKTDNPTTTLLITGSPIQRNIEGMNEQLDEYDNQVIVDAGDLLTRIAGFSAIRSGGHGVDPVLRGQSQTRINILQQGAFLHGAGPNRMDSPGAYTEPFGWDEVQIIKGVESLVYGAGGPAGTVNFKRYRPTFDESSVSGKIMAGYSVDYHKFAFDLASGNEQGYVRLISQKLKQESYQDGSGNTTRTAFETTANTLIAALTPQADKELRLSLMANRGRDALFAGTMMDGPQTDMDALQLLYLDGNENSADYREIQIYRNKAHHVMDNFSLREQTAAMRMLTDAHAETSGFKWLQHWQSDDNKIRWQASADWQNVERNADRLMAMMSNPFMLQSQIWPRNELDIKGAALEAEYLLDENNRVKSGIRYDHVNASADGLKSTEGRALYAQYYALTPARHSENNLSAFSRFYHQTETALLWAGISSTSRTADATERYVGANNNTPMMRWIGNPAIAPERHNQFELGGKWRFNQGWHELSVFYDRVDDFILRDRARMQTGILAMDMATIYRNVAATLTGFEWTIQKALVDNWIFYGNLAYVKGTNENTDRPLYQIPPIEGLIQFNHERDQWSYWFDLRFAGKQDRVDDQMMTGSALDAGESDSWAALDLKMRYQFNSQWQVSAGINNLTDETYAYHVSRANLDPFNPQAVRVNEPGRQFWISIMYDL